MTRPERQYGDYNVSGACFEGRHGECHDRACQCPHHPPTLRERSRVVRARIGRRFNR